MKTCPKCGATGADEDAFCEVDGARLAAVPTASVDATRRALVECPSCGERDADDGDGYCSACGHRIDARLTGASVAIGTVIGAMTVTAPEDAKPLGWVSSAWTVSEALAFALAALDTARSIEAQGFGWEPRADDFFVRADGTFALARLRGIVPLPAGERLHARRVLEAIGDTLLPFPLVHAGTDLVRLFCRPGPFSGDPRLTIEAAQAKLREPNAPLLEPHDRVAELCDPGLKRPHNEDATAIATGGVGENRWTVLVVCDGVSSSTHAERASAIASRTTRDALAHFASSGDIDHEGMASAMGEAIRSSHVAVCASDIEYGDAAPPGTTLVAALVYRRRLTVGWVGDSRAYWVSRSGSELLTRDHSWVNETVAHGEMTESEAMAAPLAHALTRCLGPLEGAEGDVVDIEPDVRVRSLPGPGHVVLCTDGLWNYFPTAPEIERLVETAGPRASPAEVARVLVNHALARGGGDNVSVAICRED